MATIHSAAVETNDKGVVISWGPTSNSGDVGDGVSVLGFSEMVHGAIGTFTTVTWQCSLDGGTTWGAIGAGITDTVSGTGTRLAEHPFLVRPVFTTLTGATTAYLACSKAYY